MKNTKHILFLVVFLLFECFLVHVVMILKLICLEQPMEDCSFITQDKETLELDKLKGEWWVTYLSHTDCRTVCPRTTANIVDVQEELKAAGLKPQIISFNIDPDNDEPEDLQAYAVTMRLI